MLQQLLEGPLGIERLPEVYGLFGATLTLSLLSYPYLLLTLRGAWSSLDPSAEESARSLGHGPWSAMLRVTLPQLWPAIAAGSLLVSLYTLSDFGAVSLMRYPTFTWVIFQQYESSFDRSIAAVLSLVLVGLAAAVLVLEGWTRGRRRYYHSGPGSGRPSRTVELGGWKWPALLSCSLVVGLSLALPTAILVLWLVRGVLSGEPMLFLWGAAVNSVVVSGMAGVSRRPLLGAAGGAAGPISRLPEPPDGARQLHRVRPSGGRGRAGSGLLRRQLPPSSLPDGLAAGVRLRGAPAPRRAGGHPRVRSTR